MLAEPVGQAVGAMQCNKQVASTDNGQWLKNQILLENYDPPGQLEQRIGWFVTHYATRRDANLNL